MKVQKIIESRGDGLKVAPIKNKDPLVILKDVFIDSEEEDIIKALYAQNKDVFFGLTEEDMEMAIKFKKRTRNPKTVHIILQVRPKVWQRMTEAGALYLDLQRVRVEDQSPLIQCTKCLAFGHGRKFCTESVDRCSHCGGPHLRERCADFSAGNEPQCCNCSHSGLRRTDHNAFSSDSPVRKKWDYLARANTAYA
ncbi:unnamed protein product [Parnassius apollo]|uniref:(apollo) hypothetical protein n=1 Tax=Parnassius apollo TaxID=110799 RepID=A0A8S3WZX5_PARAO|nr:unnamed protein product [Parnassius apollo]